MPWPPQPLDITTNGPVPPPSLPPPPQFAKALGVELDLTAKGLGVRSRRYAMLVEDQIIKVRASTQGIHV